MFLALITKILNEEFEMGAYISHLAWAYYQFCTGPPGIDWVQEQGKGRADENFLVLVQD